MAPTRTSPASSSAGQQRLPALGSRNPAIKCRSVDLPLPEGPTRAMRESASISKLAPSTAATPAGARPKRRDTPAPRSRMASGLTTADPPVHDSVYAVRHGGKSHAVRRDEGGAARILARHDELDQLPLRSRVDLRGRLVSDEDGRVGGQRD